MRTAEFHSFEFRYLILEALRDLKIKYLIAIISGTQKQNEGMYNSS